MGIRTALQSLAARLPQSATLDNSRHETPGRHRLRVGLLVLYVFAASAYFIWRLTVFNPEAPVFSAVFYVAELVTIVIGMTLIAVGWRRKRSVPPAPPRNLAVDVFVTAYNEPVSVIRRTVLAAINIEYPHVTWLLDDGNRTELKAVAQEFGCRYLAREHNLHAKAGNLNNALRHASGAFVAMFDADHAAQRDFLDKLLGYFADSRIAFVQTPQDFYNLDSYQHGRGKRSKNISHDISQFHYVGQPGRYHWNAATFCGSSAVVRRSALDDIGGFPTETVTEDMHAAVRLQKAGYSSAYHSEPLAFGIAPVGFAGYLRQRLRWGEGNMDVVRIEHLPLVPGLTPAQGYCYSALSWLYISAWQRLAFYLAPVVLLLFQISPIVADFEVFLAFFAPHLLLTVLTFEEFGRGYGRFFRSDVFGMAQFGAGLFATTSLVPRSKPFRVTPKLLTGRIEWLFLMPQFLVLGASTCAVGYLVWLWLRGASIGLMPWIAIFVAALAMLNALYAALVIGNAVRVARLSDKEYMHPAPLLFEAEPVSGSVTPIAVHEISVEKLTPRGQGLTGSDGKCASTIRLYLPGTSLDIPIQFAHLENSCDGAHGSPDIWFDWRNSHDRNRLDLCLHAGRWYRPVYGYHETSRTPYDVFRDVLDTGSLRGPERPGWRPALYSRRSTDKKKLCYLTDRIGGRHGTAGIIIFEKLPLGSILSVSEPGPAAGTVRRYRIGEMCLRAVQDQIALDSVGGKIHEISRQPCGAS